MKIPVRGKSRRKAYPLLPPMGEERIVLWSVFDSGGGLLGTLRPPGGLWVTQVGEDFVLGVRKDEMEVEHIRLHPIRKPADHPRSL